MSVHTCENCQYRVETNCRRNPPRATVFIREVQHPLTGKVGMAQQVVAAHPPVALDGWCGEWSRKIRIDLQ